VTRSHGVAAVAVADAVAAVAAAVVAAAAVVVAGTWADGSAARGARAACGCVCAEPGCQTGRTTLRSQGNGRGTAARPCARGCVA